MIKKKKQQRQSKTKRMSMNPKILEPNQKSRTKDNPRRITKKKKQAKSTPLTLSGRKPKMRKKKASQTSTTSMRLPISSQNYSGFWL